MNHYASSAYHESMYLHYSERLDDPKLTPSERDFLKLQKESHEQAYLETFEDLASIFYRKLLNLIKMSNAQPTAMQAEHILHMAKIIEKKVHRDEICFIHHNDERICLTDQNQVVIAWVKV